MAEKNLGTRKAAALLLALGKEATINVLKNLKEKEVEKITVEIVNINKLEPEEQDDIIEEFFNESSPKKMSKGGIRYAKEVLVSAIGEDKALDIINKLTSSFHVIPFAFLDRAEPVQIVRFLQEEQSQTISLILSYLDPGKAGLILSMLPEEIQPEVARRIAVMDQTPPEIVKQVESVLESKLSSVIDQDFSSVGGIQSLVEVIGQVDGSTEKSILDYLTDTDPPLAEEVKKMMFVFEDVLKLDARTIQRIMQEVDVKELSIALKTASEELKELIYKNMSDRAVESLKEEMEYMGPVRLKTVEESQQKVVNFIRSLEETGEITIARGEADEFV